MLSIGGCTNLHSHKQCRRVPFSPYPHHHCCRFFADGHSDQCERDTTTVVFICFSLIISDFGHFSMTLMAICMPSLEKCLQSPLWSTIFKKCVMVRETFLIRRFITLSSDFVIWMHLFKASFIDVNIFSLKVYLIKITFFLSD